CIMNGGYLAATQTAFQNSEVWSVIRKAGVTGEVWVSGTQLGLQGSWIWLSRNTPVGRMSGYTNWYPGKPSNAANSGDNCLTIGVFNTAMWNDRQCTREYPYVCEYYAPYSYSFG
ncbi:AGAP010707-PA, partial [Anopheles gambiae str. PEST]